MTTMRRGELLKRATSSSDGGSKHTAVIVIVSIAATLLLGAILFFVVRSIRHQKEVGGQGFKGRTWLQRLRSSLRRRRSPRSALSTIEVQNVSQDPEAAVNRHTSVRSIATLPAYSAVPHDGEGVIGREGDREGMDTVLEFPETAEEEEGRREQEMESLWRIRQQRRNEAAEREERRRRRREARARGDSVTLSALRHESMLRSTYRQNNGSNAMIAEHHSMPRERRVSAVNYADLGVARHDGTRVRANSANSDNQPLLEDAAGTGMASVGPWASRTTLSTHHRMHSSTSFISTSSLDDVDHSGVDRDGSDFEVISLQQTRSRAQSRSQDDSLSLRRPSTHMTGAEADLGNSRIPLPDPPQYDSVGFEEAPPYEDLESQIRGASPPPPQLPAIDRLPSIRIVESSPIEPPPFTRLGSMRTNAPPINEETN